MRAWTTGLWGLLAAAATAAASAGSHQHQRFHEVQRATSDSCAYWLDNVKHQGVAAFNPTTGYQVYRNVKDYGAKGDGATDDTAAINRAISDQGRIGPSDGNSSTTTLGVVYFPAGTYVVSSSIVDYYATQLIGNPRCLPTLQAAAGFNGLGVIDGDQYGANGLGFRPATNVFYRQIRNFVIDTTKVAASKGQVGIHWPTAQATSLQNIVFRMPTTSGVQHQGVFIEEGSGGFISDLVFYGGFNGLQIGSQQFTLRNLTFFNSVAAINQLWDWGFTYKGLYIDGCAIGLNMTGGGSAAQTVAGVVVTDSIIKNTRIAVATARTNSSQPPASGSLVLENVALTNVGVGVSGGGGATLLAGASQTTTTVVSAWAQGHVYSPSGPQVVAGPITPNTRPAGLLTPGKNIYQKSKPQYENYTTASIVSARDQGAKGDGVADDTQALQAAINTAAGAGKLLFVDAGTYRVTGTLVVPPGALIQGEGYASIMSSGAAFADVSKPKPVLQVGQSGQTGRVELSNLILSTQSDASAGTGQAGAILIQWNLASSSSAPSGAWDVHTRLGGFTGSNQQGDVCAKKPDLNATTAAQIPNLARCTVGFMSMHVTKSATGVYLENNWLWTADHDLDFYPAKNTQIAVFAGRGLLVESTSGNIWLWGHAVEHHTLYQYQLSGTKDVFMGQIQTETAYYQPKPQAPVPFTSLAAYNDPVFTNATYVANGNTTAPNADGWGLRVVNCTGQILGYGVGLYSFFNNWSTKCSDQGNGEVCQSRILQVDKTSRLSVYDLHTVGTNKAVALGDQDVGYYADNAAGFSTEIAVFRTG